MAMTISSIFYNMKTQTKELTYNLEQWKQGYRSQKQEYDYQITEIEGQIPVAIRNTHALVRNREVREVFAVTDLTANF